MPPWAFHVLAVPLGTYLKPLGPDMCGCTVSPSQISILALASWKESSLSLVFFALSVQVLPLRDNPRVELHKCRRLQEFPGMSFLPG